MLANAWIGLNRARRKARRLARPEEDREALVRTWAPGRSWLDVGAMWTINGGLSFLAEASGATRVTALDLMAATPEYEAEHARRDSKVRFVRGDLHDEGTIAQAGVHDVVWCSGVLYHAPNPLHTLDALRRMTGEVLILSTEALPEVPGLPGACVYYPALGDRGRSAYARVPHGRAHGVTEPFDPGARYANWFWGITGSALRGMLESTGFEVAEMRKRPFHLTAVARPR